MVHNYAQLDNPYKTIQDVRSLNYSNEYDLI